MKKVRNVLFNFNQIQQQFRHNFKQVLATHLKKQLKEKYGAAITNIIYVMMAL
jgi:hypothetical protein